MPVPAEHIAAMPRSGIREIMDLAWELGDVVHLEVGEPNFDTPRHICEAAAAAAMNGATRYTPNAGVVQLREALATKVRDRNHVDADASRIVVGAGAVEALYASLATVLSPGDEILLPDPGWPNFRMMADLLRARPVFYRLRPENGFRPDADEVRSLVTHRTRALLLNSPSNPLGVVLDSADLVALLDVAARYDLWVLSDECYDELTFDAPLVSPASLGHEAAVITVYSFSKSYAMTGWRVGYAVVPRARRPPRQGSGAADLVRQRRGAARRARRRDRTTAMRRRHAGRYRAATRDRRGGGGGAVARVRAAGGRVLPVDRRARRRHHGA